MASSQLNDLRDAFREHPFDFAPRLADSLMAAGYKSAEEGDHVSAAKSGQEACAVLQQVVTQLPPELKVKLLRYTYTTAGWMQKAQENFGTTYRFLNYARQSAWATAPSSTTVYIFQAEVLERLSELARAARINRGDLLQLLRDVVAGWDEAVAGSAAHEGNLVLALNNLAFELSASPRGTPLWLESKAAERRAKAIRRRRRIARLASLLRDRGKQ